jgi:alpha-galactosidase
MDGELNITLQAEGTAMFRLALILNNQTVRGSRLMGDHWERGYGGLEWRGLDFFQG